MAIRSFLAFELPAAVKETLSAVLEAGRAASLNIRWVPLANIHLTVIFIGNVGASQIRPISEVVEGICGHDAPFHIRATGIGLFGGRRNPRVLWIGLGGDVDRMASFRDALQKGLAPFGIEAEGRPFRPHLTLGRFREGTKAGAGLDNLLSRYEDLKGPDCVLRELVLFKSDLKPGGPVYTRMGAWALTGQEH